MQSVSRDVSGHLKTEYLASGVTNYFNDFFRRFEGDVEADAEEEATEKEPKEELSIKVCLLFRLLETCVHFVMSKWSVTY